MELKDKINYLRKKQNLTYEQIALEVGVGKSTVRKWEKGLIKNIRREKLSLLASALHTTEEYLTDKKKETKENSDNSFGFIKVCSAVLKIRVANPAYNLEEIIKLADKAVKEGANIFVTPELSLCGYTSADLILQKRILEECERALCRIVDYSLSADMLIAVGMPTEAGFRLYDSAVIVYKGNILGVVPKEYLSADEKRWFSAYRGEDGEITLCGQKVPFGRILFEITKDCTLGVEIGDELWTPIPPSSSMCMAGANVIINLSASSEMLGRADYRRELVKNQSARTMSGYVYSSAGVFESTTDMVYSGASFIVENGTILNEGKRFLREGGLIFGVIDTERINADRKRGAFSIGAEILDAEYKRVEAKIGKFNLQNFDRIIEPHPFIPQNPLKVEANCEEIFSLQTAGLAKRLGHTGMQKCVIGISGGLDSTLALLVAVRTLDILKIGRENVIGITMPGFGTTDRTYNNAISLMKSLGITIKEISIKDACIRHFEDIGQDINEHNVTYENAQARERTQILMDIANKEGGLLVGTGDLSEIAMGWCTYNGDHMSMYGVNSGVPKTLMRFMVRYVADISDNETAKILRDILTTPVSPELLPPDKEGNIAQKTEDKIGPYELHDFFLYYFFRFGFTKEKIAFLAREAFMGEYDDETIEKWLVAFLRRFFNAQFKRSCSPDGVKVGSVSLSPRGDLRMPSDADFTMWIE